MGQDFAEVSARARAVFDRASEVLKFDIARDCFEGPPERLQRTDIQQPAIFVASVAMWEALAEVGVQCDHFSHAAGLSLGEYTALHVAGAVGFEDALRLVARRGRLMQEAAEATESGMVTLIGGDEAGARKLCIAARGDGVLTPANFNCTGQIVISGDRAACDRAVELAGEFGFRAISLAVAGAFHSSLMQSAADGLSPVLSQTPFTATAITVIANVDAAAHGDAAAIRESLRRQVTEPVLWQRCVEGMIDAGVDRFVEIGPGRVLTGLMRKINRKVDTVNLSKAAGLDDIATSITSG